MTPDALRVALLAAEGEAVATCLAVLDDPAVTINADWDARVPTANLLTIYQRRANHVQAVGLPTLGFDETVRQLEQTPHTTLRLAAVQIEGRHPHCVIFMAPEEPQVIAALAVTGPPVPV